MRTNKYKRYDNFVKGMNRDINALNLDDNSLYTLQNCRVDKDNSIYSRYGHSKQHTTQIADGNGNMISQLREVSGTTTLLCQFLTSIYKYASSTWNSIKTGVNNTIMNILQFSDKMIMCNGIDNNMAYGQFPVFDYPNIILLGCDADKIEKRDQDDRALISEVGSLGSGNDEFNNPYGMCNDGTYVYICDSGNHRIVKRKIVDLTYVNSFGTNGSGNDNFSTPKGICTDNTYLYIVDSGNDRIKIHRCDNLSFVGTFGTNGSGNTNFDGPVGIDIEGNNLYIVDVNNTRIKIHHKSTYAYVDSFTPASLNDLGTIAVNSTHIFIGCSDLSDGMQIHKYNISSPYAQVADITGLQNRVVSLCHDSINSKLYVLLLKVSDDSPVLRKYTEALSQDFTYNLPTANSYYYGLSIGSALTVPTNTYIVKDIASPNACLATANAGAGNPNGTYKYKITWKIGTLETSAGYESNEITVSSKKIDLSNIQNPSWLQAIATAYINIYRTATGGTVYKYVGQFLASTAATTYQDNVADASLTTEIPSQNTLCPQLKYMAEYQNHIFGAGDVNFKSFLFISGLYSYDDWYDSDAGTLRFIRVYENDGDDIKGLKEYYNTLFIFKRDSIFRLTGIFPDYEVSRVITNKGTISHRTIQEYKRRLFFLSEDGIEVLAGYDIETITDNRIKAIIETINKSQEELSFSFIYKDKYYCFIPTGSNLYCDTCIIYDLINGAIYIDTGINAISGATLEDENDYEIAYITDNYGFIWQVENTSYLNDGVPSGTVNGTATGGGNNTLTDSTASFYTTGSGLKGCKIYIASGTGAGQERIIASNTGTQITVTVDWTINPSGSTVGPSIYTIGAIDSQIVTPKYNLQDNIETSFREIESDDEGSGILNHSEQVEGRTAETYTKTLSSNPTNYRYVPAAQWGKWLQLTLTQRKANDYFSHNSHTFWYKVKGEDKEG